MPRTRSSHARCSPRLLPATTTARPVLHRHPARRTTTNAKQHGLARGWDKGWERRHRAGTIPPDEYMSWTVPQTDAESVDELWTAVRSMSAGTRRSHRNTKHQREIPNLGPSETPPSEPSTIMSTPSASETLETASRTSTATSKRGGRKKPLGMPGPRDPTFEQAVLIPHRVTIDPTKVTSGGAHHYFGTDSNTMYHLLPGLEHIKAWVDTSPENRNVIMAEYGEMNRLKLCEDEFATFAKEHLLKATLRADTVREDERFRIQRLVNPSLMPDLPSHWRRPPCLQNNTAEDWGWDVRPDCSYWISLRAFNEEWQSEVHGITYVRDNIACPYFTIEFKRDNDEVGGITPAMKQVASAGTIALYNRFLLWRQALSASSAEQMWKPIDLAEIRHFGLTFTGSNFTVWILRPVLDANGDWAGCSMERAQTADCTQFATNTKKLMDWINEIHRWALTVHGPACKDEIKICLRAKGLRTSDVGMGT